MTQQAQLHRILKGIFTVEKCSVFKFCHLNSLRFFFNLLLKCSRKCKRSLVLTFPKTLPSGRKGSPETPTIAQNLIL